MSNILTVKRFQHVNTNFKILKKFSNRKKLRQTKILTSSHYHKETLQEKKFENLKVRFLGLDESGRSMSDQDY